MKVFIKSNPEHASQVANRLNIGNTSTTESPATELFDYELDDLQVSFNEADFKVNPTEAEKRKKCAMDSFTKVLTDGEKLISHRFGATTKAAGMLQAGSPVLEAKTNMGEYTIVYDDLIVTNGSIENSLATYGNYQKKRMLKSGFVTFLAVEFGKALAKKGAEELYNKFFGEDKDAALKNELKLMKDEIIEMLKNSKYENLEDKLIQTRGWLRDTYKHKINAYNSKQGINMEEIRADLKARQEEMQGIAEIIKQRIADSDLGKCDYLTRVKVTLFATCAALRIILLKEQIFWQKILAKNDETYRNDAEDNELKEYLTAISATLKDYVEKLKKGRMGKISDFNYYINTTSRVNKVGTVYKRYAHIEWSDTFESKNQADPFKGEKIKSFHSINTDEKDNNAEQVKANVQKEHADHVAAVKGLFNQYIEEPLNGIINNLNTDNLKIG